MKIALNFIVNINQMPNNHESTYFNLIVCSISNIDISANIQLKS